MPIDVEKVLGSTIHGDVFSWRENDIILYNLAVGAGNPPIDHDELRYTYEGDLRAVPTFGTIPPFGLIMKSMLTLEGLDISLAQVLHGEQELTVHRPIPTSGSVAHSGQVANVYDKGKGALVVFEATSSSEKTGEPLFTNRSSIFIRGEGGFGGDRGPSARDLAPDRGPDLVAQTPTLPQQALLYRLSSGDRNPLHVDPGFAAMAGYERPILHGLCTYGVVAKAVVDSALGGDPNRFGSFRARFSGHVFPGETLVTRIWKVDDGLVVEAGTLERGKPVLSNARLEVV